MKTARKNNSRTASQKNKKAQKRLFIKPGCLALSFTTLWEFRRCPRCFYFKTHGWKKPDYHIHPIFNRIDLMMKDYYDRYRGTPEGLPPALRGEVKGKLVDQKTVDEMRNGIGYFDEELQASLWGKLDDCLYIVEKDPKTNEEKTYFIPLDNKSRDKFQKEISERDQLQLDVYTYLEKMTGRLVKNLAVLAQFIPVAGEPHVGGPWPKDIRMITTNPDKVRIIFAEAVKTYHLPKEPEPSPTCEHCKFLKEVKKVVRTNYRKKINKK